MDTENWSVRFDTGEAAWSVEYGNVRRALIPLGGARPYRGGHCRISDAQSRREGDLAVAECTAHLASEGEAAIQIRDVVRMDGHSLMLHRSWRYGGPRTVPGVEFAIEVLPAGAMEEHLIPGCLYDGNAQAAPARLVPRLKDVALFEEHKCPTPMVAARFCAGDGTKFGVALLPEPCAVVDGHVPDQWWSLGLRVDGQAVTLMSVSGRLAVNGEDERVYDAQNRVSPYPDAWVDARPRHVYEKHARVDFQAEPRGAWSWRAPLRRAIAEQPPLTASEEALISAPALEEAVRLKVGYALRRWHDDGDCAGMLWYPRRPEFEKMAQSVEYGWVGQNMRLGMSLWRWGRRCGDAELCRRGERCAEAWVKAAATAFEQGRVAPTRYIIGKGWRNTIGGEGGFSRPTMETLFELADFCGRTRDAGAPHPDWEQTLSDGLDFYGRSERRNPDGIFPLKWDRDGIAQPAPVVTAGVLMVAALAEAARLPGGAGRLDLAAETWQRYADVFLGDAPRHPCGSALDSRCEDMESGMFLLISALRLAGAMRRAGRPADARLIRQATQAADWVLSWTYTWNVPLLGGTLLAAAGFESRGWSDVSVQNRCCHPYTAAAQIAAAAAELGRFSSAGLSDVSVQNRHLHVYSANAEILRLADETAPELGEHYRRQARRMLAPIVRTIARPECRWGMDEDGEQTEQYNHTNYIQHPSDPVCRPRGGIARWFVPWITVWVLSVCLDFLEYGEKNNR